jgi:hypothetical protein
MTTLWQAHEEGGGLYDSLRRGRNKSGLDATTRQLPPVISVDSWLAPHAAQAKKIAMVSTEP